MSTILITGASSGIGRATAEVFLAQGWTVGLLARNEGALRDVAAASERAIVLPADVTDPEAVEAAFDVFVVQAGRLDVLFNNAGIFTPAGPIDEIAVADWLASVNVNLTGMFLCARAAFGRMRLQSPQGGRIINNGSIAAHSPRDGSVCYTATKHGVTGLTKSLSLDGRRFDIACGQIDIGNAETPLLSAVKARDPQMQTMDVDHAAQAVLHMASLPAEANVMFMTVMATKMPYIGRG